MHDKIRIVKTDDTDALFAALVDALNGGCAVLPVSPEYANNHADFAAEIADLAENLPENTALIIHTSGSTGVPKAVALSAYALRQSADATHEALGGAGQWLVCLPTHLISGAQMLVRSIIAGTEPVFAGESFKESARKLTADRRYVSLVPVQLARLMDEAEQDAQLLETLRRFDAILVGGGALSVDDRQRAFDLGLNVVRSYGSTETAGGCVYDGSGIGDTRVRLCDGEVQLSGDTLALGYLGDETQTKARFIEDNGVRWYRTGDSGTMWGGVLQVTGRLDRVLISGGVNVSLAEIERVLSAVKGWDKAVAVPVSSVQWGERPVLVVAENDIENAESFIAVQSKIKQQLGAAAVPDRALIMSDLPRLLGGKPDLKKIQEYALLQTQKAENK